MTETKIFTFSPRKGLRPLPIYWLILLCLSSLLNAQTQQEPSTTTNTTSQNLINNEANTNQIIYDNAEKTKANAKNGSYLKILSNPDGSATQAANLTDEQKVLSENFVHQGVANRVLTEKCSSKEMQQICNGQDPNSGRRSIIDGVAKAYAIFGAMMDDKFLALKKRPSSDDAKSETKSDTKNEAKNDSKSDNKEKKEENQTDYCKYIPVATETISMFMQQSAGKLLTLPTSSNETAQKETILKAAKNHDERAKGAQIQAAGWWGAAGCYGIMAATGTQITMSLGVKLGAAAFLGAVYQKEVSENKEYAKKTRAVADSLPGKGDCNPVTQKGCYCAQPETENDTTYCYTDLHKKALAQNSARVTCVDSNLKADPACACEGTKSCFDHYMINQDTNNELGFGMSAGSPFSGIRQLARGELLGGTLSGTTYAQTAAIARRGLNTVGSKLAGPNQNLNPNEMKLASMFQEAGIPGNIAAHMAVLSVPKSALDMGFAKARGTSGYSVSIARPSSSNNIVEFGTGNGLIKTKNGKKEDDINSKFGSLLKKSDTNNPNSRFIEFAVQKAQSQNQITKTDSSIFEIISNRYAGSAFRMLELEDKK